MRNSSRFYSLILLACLALAACAPQGGESVGTSEGERPAGEPRGYDPLELPQDREIVPQLRPQTGPITGRDQLVARDTVAVDTAVTAPRGNADVIDPNNSQAFRVQLFTSKLFGEARRQVVVAEEIFDQPVYMDYEVPYFKVRVGNFADREAAESYQQKAKAAGYTNAWVVLVTVKVQEVSPLYDQGLSHPVIDSAAVPNDSTQPSVGPDQE